jgi:hypothetical protein
MEAIAECAEEEHSEPERALQGRRPAAVRVEELAEAAEAALRESGLLEERLEVRAAAAAESRRALLSAELTASSSARRSSRPPPAPRRRRSGSA